MPRTPTDAFPPLTAEQSAVYEALLARGPGRARDIAARTGLARTHAYKILGELQALHLVKKEEPQGKVAIFHPLSPVRLAALAEKARAQEEARYRAAMAALPRLFSAYNLLRGKPGVRFYEGKEGAREVLEHSLSARETIYSFADLEAIETHIPALNREYVRRRERRGVKKRGIVPDSAFARRFLANYPEGITETRVIKWRGAPEAFNTVMQMYDATTSYLTLGAAQLIGIIIEDPSLTRMHRALFEVMWEQAAVPLSEGGTAAQEGAAAR